MTPIGMKLISINGEPINEMCALIGWQPRLLDHDADILLIRSNGAIEQHRLNAVQLNSQVNVIPVPAGALHRV